MQERTTFDGVELSTEQHGWIQYVLPAVLVGMLFFVGLTFAMMSVGEMATLLTVVLGNMVFVGGIVALSVTENPLSIKVSRTHVVVEGRLGRMPRAGVQRLPVQGLTLEATQPLLRVNTGDPDLQVYQLVFRDVDGDEIVVTNAHLNPEDVARIHEVLAELQVLARETPAGTLEGDVPEEMRALHAKIKARERG